MEKQSFYLVTAPFLPGQSIWSTPSLAWKEARRIVHEEILPNFTYDGYYACADMIPISIIDQYITIETICVDKSMLD